MLKIVLMALSGAFIVIYLKSINSEYATLALTSIGILLFSSIITYFDDIYDIFSKLQSLSGIDNEIFKIIFKITAISYLTEFACGTIEDMGLNGLSDKLVFAGKIIILSVSMPIFKSIIDIVMSLVQ